MSDTSDNVEYLNQQILDELNHQHERKYNFDNISFYTNLDKQKNADKIQNLEEKEYLYFALRNALKRSIIEENEIRKLYEDEILQDKWQKYIRRVILDKQKNIDKDKSKTDKEE